MSTKGNQTGHDIEAEVSDLYNPGHADGGDAPRGETVTVGSGEDISSDAKDTLSDYLGALVSGQVDGNGNAFRIRSTHIGSEGNLSNVDSTLSTRDAGGDILGGTTLGSFLDVVRDTNSVDGGTAVNRFNQTSTSQYNTEENPFVESGLSAGAPGKGHHLLPEVKHIPPIKTEPGSGGGGDRIDTNPEDYPEVQKKISQVLKSNRFNPSLSGTPFIVDNARGTIELGPEKTDTKMGFSRQTELGVYNPNADEVWEEALKRVGGILTVAATGHTNLQGADIGEPWVLDAASLPSLAQFTGWDLIDGANILAGNIDVEKFTDDPGSGVTKNRTTLLDEENSYKSYGHLNSNLEPFDGPVPFGMLFNTLAGFIGLVGVSALINLFVEMGSGDALSVHEGGLEFPYMDPHRLKKGSHAESDRGMGSMFAALFGIPELNYNFVQCLFAGMLSFYGLQFKPVLLPHEILQALMSLGTAPGYYTVITRNVIRDTQQIVDAITEFAQIGLGSVTGFIAGLFKMIEAVVTSATYRFIMTIASVGNVRLTHIQGHPILSMGDERMLDELPDTPSNRHKKSRAGEDFKRKMFGKGRQEASSLTWRHASAPARYLLPSSYIYGKTYASFLGVDGSNAVETKLTAARNGKADPGDDGGKSDLTGVDGKKFDGTATNENGNRLSKEYVEWIEHNLETEYMPFYFHDLRTNEIISFHAFMTDLQDSFSAEYNSTGGYGRADDILTYSKTSRNISLSFMLVATSQEDHDVMYYNVNKLVSMMYPQYSRGRVVEYAGEGDSQRKFVQPFSQIPTASPMIRLRFGDWLKSNYSKFGISRLFGIGELNENASTIEQPIGTSEREKLLGVRDAAITKFKKEQRERSIDPGAMDAAQIAAALLGSTNHTTGYVNGDLVEFTPRKSYILRNLVGMTAVQAGKKAGGPEADALFAVNFGNHVPRGKVVYRIPIAKGKMSITTPATTPNNPASQEPVAGQPMGYLVEIMDGTPTRKMLGPQISSFKYIRVMHNEIIGLTPEFRQKFILDEIKNSNEIEPPTKDAFANFGEQVTAAGGTQGGRGTPSGPGAVAGFFAAGATGAQFRGNPIIRSFESAGGRGLAGFMTEISFDQADMPWETSIGQRAPMALKVSVTFKPIHDIPMGLDSHGMMRSVAYGVGSISNSVNGDVYEGGLEESKTHVAENIGGQPQRLLSARSDSSEG